MKTVNRITANFQCSLEQAFSIPILGDATQFLEGYFVIPKVIAFEEDETWGQIGGSRLPISAGNLFSKKGPIGFDEILVREENQYWKWQVTKFRDWSMFFLDKAVGEWRVEDQGKAGIYIQWTYSIHSKHPLLHPFAWVFAKIWKGMQLKAIKKMQKMAEQGTALVYI